MKIILFTLFSILMISGLTFGQTPPLETGVSQTLAKWRAANYSDLRYKLNITLEKGAPLMRGNIEISVKLTEEGKQNDLVLDWRATQFQNDKDKPFAAVIQVNDAMMEKLPGNNDRNYYWIDKEHLLIEKKYLKKGENKILVQFASPIKTSGSAITRYVDKEDGAEYVYSLFVPSDASTAFPVFDQPDLKARFQLSLKIPVSWRLITNASSNGTARVRCVTSKPETDCGTLHQFEETKPISTYVFAFAAGEFAEFDCRGEACPRPPTSNNANANGQQGQAQPLRPETKIYVRKSQAEKFKQHAAEVFRLNREGVKFLAEFFDYKFPFPKYDLVLIPEFPFGGMEHAGATFLRESSIIFPSEPTKNDYVSRANLIFHEAAHQWFGDTVTMKWFDDLWLKEGFAEFMAYKTLEKVMPEYNSWKIFYERNKQAAYLTDSTRGTTPIYQEIKNLSAAKSAYGNIVYRKAPSFLKQAEFYLGADKFQIAVRAFLKNHEFANAEWTDLVREFEKAGKIDLTNWADVWVKQRGMPKVKSGELNPSYDESGTYLSEGIYFEQANILNEPGFWLMKTKVFILSKDGESEIKTSEFEVEGPINSLESNPRNTVFVFPNYQDYGYGIFLLDEKSRAYVLANIQNEKDDFLRAMMWGSLWDSVRETELDPKTYVELVIKNINVESDESTIQTLLGRVSTAMNYYIESSGDASADRSEPSAVAGGLNVNNRAAKKNPSATADGSDLRVRVEKLLVEKLTSAPTVGQKITYFRALQSIGSGVEARQIFKDLLNGKSKLGNVELKTKDKFDLLTRLLILDDKDAPAILARLEKTETSDEAKRYAYAAKAGIKTAENKQKFWNDFVSNKEVSESWIEAAFIPFNSNRHSELTLPFLEKALAELPNLKRNRKIFFVNGWLSAFIGGQKSEQALAIVNNFLESNPNLDRDLRLKILENSDNLERAVKIRAKY